MTEVLLLDENNCTWRLCTARIAVFWILHPALRKAAPHRDLSVHCFLVCQWWTMIPHASYFPDLFPLLIQRMERKLKSNEFNIWKRSKKRHKRQTILKKELYQWLWPKYALAHSLVRTISTSVIEDNLPRHSWIELCYSFCHFCSFHISIKIFFKYIATRWIDDKNKLS